MRPSAIVGIGQLAHGQLADSVYRGTPAEAAASSDEAAAEALRDAGLLPEAVVGVVAVGATAPPVRAATTGPVQIVSPGAGAAFAALEAACRWLADGAVDAALVVEAASPAAVVLAPAPAPGAYAWLTALHRGAAPAGLQQEVRGVGYIEVVDEALDRLPDLYRHPEAPAPDLTCAVGGAPDLGGPLVALIRAALCLHRRIIPPTPPRLAPPDPEAWAGTRLYAATEGRPWFRAAGAPRRRAAIHSPTAHAVLAAPAEAARVAAPLPDAGCFLIPIVGEDRDGLLRNLGAVERALASATPASLASVAQRARDAYRPTRGAYALALVGRDRETLTREIAFAREGIDRALAQGEDWVSPQGSAFAARPLGAQGGVAFVYPGAFNAYRGLGRDLFHHFPELHARFGEITSDPGGALAERALYPRARRPLSKAKRREHQARLAADPVALISAGTSFAILATSLVRDRFGVQPQAALGYSLGEISMLWAAGVWTDGDAGLAAWQASPLLKTQLAGPKEIVRRRWGDGATWATYIVKAPVPEVRARLAQEPRVSLTIVNTADEAVIAGDPAGCRRVIAALDCHALPLAQDAVLHAPVTRAAYDAFVALYLHPTTPAPDLAFYSAHAYAPLVLERAALAQALAAMCCAPVDFPRLVERAYADGARIFVELGPQRTCSRWIARILQGRPHVAVPIDRANAPDLVTLYGLLARLIAHRVPVDLAPLSAQPPAAPARTAATAPLRETYEQHLLPHRRELAHSHATFLRTRLRALHGAGAVIRRQMAVADRALAATRQRGAVVATPVAERPAFDGEALAAFATGELADCFGPDFEPYRGRRAPRIPNGDLLMMSRIRQVDGRRGQFEGAPGVVGEYDVPAAAWYLQDGAEGQVPYALLMEMGMQPCGFLSAYLGSTLPYPEQDFYFRNLDGRGRLLRAPDLRGRTVVSRVWLREATSMPGIIVQTFDFALACEPGGAFYEGAATFGYFTARALRAQRGLDGGRRSAPWLERAGPGIAAQTVRAASPPRGRLGAPEVVRAVEGGGRHEGGYLYAEVPVAPDAWFFDCHFYQDPVMPGSLGVEAVLRAMARYGRSKKISLPKTESFPREKLQVWEVLISGTTYAGQASPPRPAPGHETTWTYRGQVTPANRRLRLEVHLEPEEATEAGVLVGDASVWNGDLRIYEVRHAAILTS
jgi:PfaB family protein